MQRNWKVTILPIFYSEPQSHLNPIAMEEHRQYKDVRADLNQQVQQIDAYTINP